MKNMEAEDKVIGMWQLIAKQMEIAPVWTWCQRLPPTDPLSEAGPSKIKYSS